MSQISARALLLERILKLPLPVGPYYLPFPLKLDHISSDWGYWCESPLPATQWCMQEFHSEEERRRGKRWMNGWVGKGKEAGEEKEVGEEKKTKGGWGGDNFFGGATPSPPFCLLSLPFNPFFNVWHGQTINFLKLKIIQKVYICNTYSYMPCVVMAHPTKLGGLIIQWRWGLVFIHNLVDNQGIQRKEESYPWMNRTHCTVLLKVHEYSYEWFWLIGIYLWMSETFGFGHKVMVATPSHFEQSASQLGKNVWTLLATISDDLHDLIWNQIIPRKCRDHLVTAKLFYN